jgi:hypothetical protein
MNLTPYEQLTPGTIARSDQELARFHERATRLGKAVAVALYPEPDDTCGGGDCTRPALLVVAALYGKPERIDVPVCEQHYGDGAALRSILAFAMESAGYTIEPGTEYVEYVR